VSNWKAGACVECDTAVSWDDFPPHMRPCYGRGRNNKPPVPPRCPHCVMKKMVKLMGGAVCKEADHV